MSTIHRMHATVGYVLRMLEARPDMLDCVTSDPNVTLEEALAELRSRPVNELLSCGHDDCPECSHYQRESAS